MSVSADSLQKQHHSSQSNFSVSITPVFPLDDEEVDFDQIDCEPVGTEINLVDDAELPNMSIVEILNPKSYVKFNAQCDDAFPMLTVLFKFIDKYFSLFVVVMDTAGRKRIIDVSNKRSIITIDKDTAKLPLIAKDGWRHISLNLNDVLAHAFGTKLRKSVEVTVTGSCRIAKIYFHAAMYADPQLPPFLR